MASQSSMFRIKLSFIIFTSLVFFCVVVFLPYLHNFYGQAPISGLEARKLKRPGFLVDTPYCKIPNIDPFDPSIPNRVKQKGKNIQCTGKALTYVDGTMLRINRASMDKQMKKHFSHCHYEAVNRSSHSDFSFHYTIPPKKFNSHIKIQDEFIRVQCYNRSGRIISVMFHAVIFPKKYVEKRCDTRMKMYKKTVSPKEILNVEMIGVDSLSRMNMIRQMPRTRQFLLKELGAVEMLGYNKVALNTKPNIVPMLSGKFLEELHHDNTKTFDEYSWIWKNFSAAGYRTLYAEDVPKLNMFTFASKGFQTPPTDYYFRPLALAMAQNGRVWNRRKCIVNMLEIEMVLKYHMDFSRQFRNKPRFGFSFFSSLTHDSINLAGAGDDAYLRFLQTFKAEGRSKNTVLIYFSDHGFRLGNFLSTFIGKLEGRLPPMFIALPRWFKTRYPAHFKNLQINSNRLTTHFDVYETLKEVLFFDGKDHNVSSTKRGISLFREIPENRSCGHAGIVPQWCTCMKTKTVSTSNKTVQLAAHEIVNSINSLIADSSHLCASLTLKVIHGAEQMIPDKEMLSDRHNHVGRLLYQLIVETEPGNGQFEGTIHFNEHTKAFTLAGAIVRINRYGSQSKCVSESVLKQFCYCI